MRNYLPEWLLSTPRLMAILLVLTACFLAIRGDLQPVEFVPIVMLALTFFYQQRKPENKTDTNLPPPKNPDEHNSQ